MIKCFYVERIFSETRPCDCGDRNCREERTEITWRRADTGQTLKGYPDEFGPGAMWFAQYSVDEWGVTDAQHLMVALPLGGAWDIDSRADNCTLKEDTSHRCWVRHGDPPNITVDKNGWTCGAGGGSIIKRGTGYHAMLTNGELIPCGAKV